ncbi:hypothetical protein BDN67DRAFT_873980, partial [Paxillus ammoniavirescens]
KYKLKSDDLELVTVLETICADGTATVLPCFVFSGTNHSAEWYELDDGILIATTENGWTSEKVCLDWFTSNFIPATKAHADPTKPIVLI